MVVSVSEDIGRRARDPYRFCATVDGDTNAERAGFGASERAALWSLAQQLGMHPATLAATAEIERLSVRS